MKAQRAVLICLAIALLAGACASRPETGYLASVSETAEGASDHDLLVATTRERDARPGTLFSGERAAPLDYAKIRISIPPSHSAGQIEWPSQLPGNPKTDIVVREAAYLAGDRQFIAHLNSQLAKRPRGQRGVFLFIHGYNTLFAEGLYRFAQIIHDSKAPAVPVLFTWASRGKIGEYVYDNNSATAARDDLEHTIRMLFASDAEEVNILAHSMGNWATVEALRQIKISERLPNIRKLGSLVLAAPDIDLDVFKSQIRRFGKPPKPFFIILSKDDKALQISNFIAGGEGRLGSVDNTEELAALGAIVIDLTDVKAADPSNHAKFAQLAAIAPQLRAVLENGVGANSDSASRAQQANSNTLGAIISLPGNVLGLPIKIISGR